MSDKGKTMKACKQCYHEVDESGQPLLDLKATAEKAKTVKKEDVTLVVCAKCAADIDWQYSGLNKEHRKNVRKLANDNINELHGLFSSFLTQGKDVPQIFADYQTWYRQNLKLKDARFIYWAENVRNLTVKELATTVNWILGDPGNWNEFKVKIGPDTYGMENVIKVKDDLLNYVSRKKHPVYHAVKGFVKKVFKWKK